MPKVDRRLRPLPDNAGADGHSTRSWIANGVVRSVLAAIDCQEEGGFETKGSIGRVAALAAVLGIAAIPGVGYSAGTGQQ